MNADLILKLLNPFLHPVLNKPGLLVESFKGKDRSFHLLPLFKQDLPIAVLNCCSPTVLNEKPL
jgi:hypothetical protein